MIAYVDASVLLRLLLREPKPLASWHEVTTTVSSALIEVECLRTLDRLRFRGKLDDDDLARIRDSALRMIVGFDLVQPSPSVLRRAAEPFATPLGTLDGVHLATAMAWRDGKDQAIVVATHDTELAQGARAHGFSVIGA